MILQEPEIGLCVSIGCFLKYLLQAAAAAAAAAAKSLQLCPKLCDPIDSSPPGSAVPGILQARTLEWVAISFSNAWKWKVKVKLLSHFWLLAIPWSAAYQAPPSMGFSRQEYWSGVPLPSLSCMLSCFNCVQLFVILQTVACQGPLSMGFPRQEYWSGLSYLPPEDLPDVGTEPASFMSPALAGGFFTVSGPWEGYHLHKAFSIMSAY